MRRPAAALLLALTSALTLGLTACGGASSSPAARTPRSTAATSPGAGHAPPFQPRTATASLARWRLPVASGRQALVDLGGGRVLVAGGLVAGDSSTDRVTQVDLPSGTTRAMPSLAVPVHDVAGGMAAGTPLVVGGGNATEQDVVQALDHGTWRVVGHLPTTRSDLSAVGLGGTLLAIGGYDGVGTPTPLLALGPQGSVTTHGRLSQGVRYAATAVLGHTAYVFGGEVSGRELDAVQAVDLRTGRTRVVAHLPVPLGHAMAATEGERILIMGGRVTPDRQTAAMWWFDPASGRFTPAGRLPTPLSDAAVATWGHRAWLLGGEDPVVTDRVVFVQARG